MTDPLESIKVEIAALRAGVSFIGLFTTAEALNKRPEFARMQHDLKELSAFIQLMADKRSAVLAMMPDVLKEIEIIEGLIGSEEETQH